MAAMNSQPSTAQTNDHPDRAPQLLPEDVFQLLFERSPDAIFLVDGDAFVDCNQSAVEMFRYSSKKELLSTHPLELSPLLQPDGLPSSEKARDMIATAIEKGSHRVELMGRRLDESEFPVEVLLTAIPVADRHILHTVWRDISRRKGAELARITERKKEDAFRAGQSRVLEMIARGTPLGEVLASLVLLIEAQSDDMLCSVLQLSEDGKYIRSGAAPSLPEIYVKAVDGAPIGPKNGSCGTAMFLGQQVIVTDMLEDPLWEDYHELAVLSGLRACWSTPIFSGSGKVLGSFAMYYRQPQTPSGTEARLTEVATHIAGIAIEHQRAEEQLRRTQAELAHVSRVTTMGELAASIAHEVNQPLGAIVGNADICLQWLRDAQPDLAQLREAIEDIASDGRRASEVIARIRSLVKKNVAEKAPLDVCEVAREVFDLVRHEAHRRQVTLHGDLEAGLPLVKGDRVQLQQVLLNLVMNGIESMSNLKERRPELTVRIWKSESGEVLTSVCDCGAGIRPEDAEQLFRPFHTTKAAGMGMGLAISRSIVEAHGGRLWIEPTPEPGAMFKFAIPICVEGGP